MKRQLSMTILFCMIAVSLPAQTAESNFYDALFFYEEEEDFQEAQYLFQEVLKKEPNNANVKFLLGMCYNNIQGAEHKGIPYLTEATRSISLKYKSNKYSEKRAPQHTWFYLAEAYRKTNQMDEALNALKSFREIKDFEKKYNAR
ncbi:MAG: tetratricopeptide repeat protein, partial [Bacteroidales bacterium]|nr:tetratricopeptide repeat protein [Bacteroidales bacterium]